MTPITASSGAAPLNAPATPDRAKLKKAAQAFEAILVKQMLQSARSANFGGELLASKGLETFNTMQDERFAQITAESGKLGFANMIEAQLAKNIQSPSRLREGLGVGLSQAVAHPRPLPQAGGEE